METQTQARKATILAVDDEPQNLKMFERALRKDYHVITAESAHDGLRKLEENPDIAVIVTDQRMPNMTGIEMLKVSRERTPDKVRIILTGYTDPSDLIDAINSSRVFCYITKPWKVDEMRRVLRRAVNLHNSGGLDTIDEITGLPNHTALERIVRRELARVEQVGTVLTIVSFTLTGLAAFLKRELFAAEEATYQIGLALREVFDRLSPGGVNPVCHYDAERFIGLTISPKESAPPVETIRERCRTEIEGSEAFFSLQRLDSSVKLVVRAARYQAGDAVSATDFMASVIA